MQLGITDQIRRAAQKQNRIAALVGLAIGAFVPLAVYWLAHHEANVGTWRGWAALGFVVSGLAFSATTVFGWAQIAFRMLPKALGFVILLEGTMTIATTQWLALVALLILTAINAVATACNFADDQRESRAAAKVTKPAKRDTLFAAHEFGAPHLIPAPPKPKQLPRVVSKARKPVAAKTVRAKAVRR